MFSSLERDTKAILNLTDWECVLRRNSAAGSTSGLQIFFKQFNTSDRLINASRIIGRPAVRVCVCAKISRGFKRQCAVKRRYVCILLFFVQIQIFYVNEYPESGMGSIIAAEKGTKLSVLVKPFVTISTNAIKHLPVAERFCYFPDEKRLSVSQSYTQKSCLVECRLNYLHKICHCRPYYFNMVGEFKMCLTHLLRIFFYKIPSRVMYEQ